MKKFLEGIGLIVSLIVLVGCGTSQGVVLTDVSPTLDTKIPFETIAQGAVLGDTPQESAYLVIESPTKWDQVQELLPDQVVTQVKMESGIDDIVLLAYAGVKKSSGYAIEIKSVTVQGCEIKVIISETPPAEDAIVEPATTLPFHAISILKGNLGTGDTYTLYFNNEKGGVLKKSIFSLE